MDFLLDPQTWASLVTLTALEIVLGIDNLVFIAILSSRVPKHQQSKARRVGLGLAVITRLMLLGTIAWLASVTTPLFSLAGREFSLRDLVLLAGGLFLLAKGTTEIHDSVEGEEEERQAKASGFVSVVVQIMILDIVFSLDSVVTAVGMANQFMIMASAIIIAVGIMIFASDTLAHFINTHLSIKLLALSFLILVGVALIADSLGFHVPKGYLYFAIAFSTGVEALNLWAAGRRRKRGGGHDPALER